MDRGGIALLVSVQATAAAVAGLVLLGHGQRDVDARPRDRDRRPLRGAAYGSIAGVAGSMTTAARAVAPFAAAVYAAAVGYTALFWTLVGLALVAALLALRAEQAAGSDSIERHFLRPG